MMFNRLGVVNAFLTVFLTHSSFAERQGRSVVISLL